MDQGLWERRETNFRGSVITHYREIRGERLRKGRDGHLGAHQWPSTDGLQKRGKRTCAQPRSIPGKDLERLPGEVRTNKDFILLGTIPFWIPIMSQRLGWKKQTQTLPSGSTEFSQVGEGLAYLHVNTLSREWKGTSQNEWTYLWIKQVIRFYYPGYIKKLSIPVTKIKTTQVKMGKGLEQTFLHQWSANGNKPMRRFSAPLTTREMQVKPIRWYHFYQLEKKNRRE